MIPFKLEEFVSYLDKITSHDFVIGIVVAVFVITGHKVVYERLKSYFTKHTSLVDKCNDIHKSTKSALDELSEIKSTISQLEERIKELSSTINEVKATLVVVDRNTSSPQSSQQLLLINQMIVELDKSIGALSNSIKLLEQKVLTQLKKLEGSDYDM